MSRDTCFPSIIIMAVAAILAGAAGITRADDSSLSRFGGDGYAYFVQNKPFVVTSTSTFRQTYPNGLSALEYQALSSPGPAWHPAPVLDRTPSTFRQNSPTGLTEDDYLALSSNSSRWQLSSRARVAATGSLNAAQKAAAR